MKTILFIVSVCFTFNVIHAQDEIHYNNPPSFVSPDVRVNIEDAVSTADYCKMKLVIDNKSTKLFYVLKADQTAFSYDGIGKYYPKKSKELVVMPDDKGSYVAKVDRDMDYRKSSFVLILEGLLSGSSDDYLSVEPFNLSSGKSLNKTFEKITFSMEEFEGKKGKYSAKVMVSFNGADDELLTIDPLKFKLVTATGNEVLVDWSINKIFTLRPGEVEKIKLSFESLETEFILQQEGVYQKIILQNLPIDPFTLVDANPAIAKEKKPEPPKTELAEVEKGNEKEEKTVANSSKSSCPPFMGQATGSVKIKIYSEDGLCFKLDIDGFPAITEFTSNAFVYANPGRRRYTLTMADGTVIEDKSYIADTYDEIGYKVKSKGGTDYAFKYVPGDQVLNAHGKQQREEMMAQTKASAQSALDKSKAGASTTNNSGSNSTSNGNQNSSGGGSCFGENSSGMETVKLKITWKGSPVSGHGIQVKVGGTPLGNNVTDGSGNVSIKVSSLPSQTIDVFGCKGNNSWSVTGDWVQLDGSNYFHLKLDELAEMMAEMMGMSVDQIGAGWGM